MTRTQRAIVWICALVLVLSVLPLYAISLYNHPYYDDFSFSAAAHHAWKETGNVGAVLLAAWDSAKTVRQTWQGTYTGTLLSNVQPGVFAESLYYLGTFFLLTVFLLCFLYFFSVAFQALGLAKWEAAAVGCLALFVMIQFLPDVGEAFFWFNGGIGNVFVYALLALAAALFIRLYQTKRTAYGLALAPLMALLGGGSYSGGLFGLCCLGLCALWLLWKRRPTRWWFLGLWLLFLVCFAYSVFAPGNGVRAGVIGYRGSAVKAVAQALYYGAALMGSYLRLPLLGVTALLSPLFARAARKCPLRFSHPWPALFLLGALYCAQLAPTLYSGVHLGGGRTVDTYWISFVTLWLLYAFYLTGFLVRRFSLAPDGRRLVALGLCLTLAGCMGFKRPEDRLYGAQNMAGVSAALSLINGEAATYDREMTAREDALNDASQPAVTLRPLTAVPAVFMDDLLSPDALYDVREPLKIYYGKTSVEIAGEGAKP